MAVSDFRVVCFESERGWGSSWENIHFETIEKARSYFNENQPTEKTAPDYYFIAKRIEKFNPETKEWDIIK